LQPGYKVKMKDGSMRELLVSELAKGVPITVYYMPKTKKVDGEKKKYNEIFAIDFKPKGR